MWPVPPISPLKNSKATSSLVALLFLAYYPRMAKIIRTLFGLRQPAPATEFTAGFAAGFAAEFAAIRQSSAIPVLTAYLAHYDGYLREAALVRATELASPELLPAVTARLNDWVPQVRRAAKNAILTIAPALPAAALLALLPAIQQLRNARREDHGAWVRQFEGRVLDTIGPAAVIDGIHDQAIRIARACFELALAHSLLPADTLARQGLLSPDIRIAMKAVDLVRNLPGTVQQALYLQALGASFGAVRTTAMRALLADSSGEHEALARAHLFDAQSSVRSTASNYLQRRGIDTDALYVDALLTPGTGSDRIRICLLALGASGKAEHARHMEAYATSPAPWVQMAALMGWVRLAPTEKDRIAVLALQSPIPRVRKLSLILIRDYGAYVPVETALAMAAAHQDYGLMLRLSRQEPWLWIDTIARIACASPASDELRALLAQDLVAWIASSGSIYAAPEPKQVELLGAPDTRAALAGLLPHATSLHSRLDYTISQALLGQG